MNRAVLAGCLSLAACVAPGVADVRLVDSVTIDLGEAQPGRLKWLSANARFVALYLGVDARASDRACADPRLVLFDTVRGTRENLESIVAVDPRGRYAVALLGSQLWLIDSETGLREDLARRGADLTRDDGACWGGRQAVFDPWGQELLYLRTDPTRAVVRRLATGEEYEVAAPERPVIRATPLGHPGWVRFDMRRPSSWRHAAEPPDPCCRPPVDPLWEDEDSWPWYSLRHRDGRTMDEDFADDAALLWPSQPHISTESFSTSECRANERVSPEAVHLSCTSDERLLWPTTGRTVVLENFRGWIGEPVLASDGRLWRAATVSQGHGVRFARVDLTDGRIELGPEALSFNWERGSRQDRRGWLLVKNYRSDPLAFAYDPVTGRTREITGADVLAPGLVVVDGQHFAVDVSGARRIRLDSQPAAVSENGCALMSPTRPETGALATWSLQCPTERTLRF
ncbi:hypothetical protein [Nannocystis punicea]|uniref:Uncharacterized protein n=1 Tax=Nannocystis punicea TaxID=2995304 RepID=A0ABY7H5I1_9BACT|nr:hypothetical protein [Nannocystis poenicansa]WAS94224.1 hypothetical protein O0S08_49510 [Nannocystis poenicansa]